jgi:hypothetical protein
MSNKMEEEEPKPRITFSVNSYDKDGNEYEKGIYLHFNKLLRIKVGSMRELDSWITQLHNIRNEIENTYGYDI